jgi:hypothetical protein
MRERDCDRRGLHAGPGRRLMARPGAQSGKGAQDEASERAPGQAAKERVAPQQVQSPRATRTGLGILTVYSRLRAHRQFLEHAKPPQTILKPVVAVAAGKFDFGGAFQAAAGSSPSRPGPGGARGGRRPGNGATVPGAPEAAATRSRTCGRRCGSDPDGAPPSRPASPRALIGRWPGTKVEICKERRSASRDPGGAGPL